ncbi:MAG TPA: D-aminoacylase [Vicinamibacteria bacterium]|nr:D-aminoacylase [Vicinamibacteria bacterium]
MLGVSVAGRVSIAGLAAITLAAIVDPLRLPEKPSFDLIIESGRIVDGSGNPWYRADVGVRGGRIVAIGRLKGATALRRIDALERVVAPGFIDLMGSSDWQLLVDPRAASKVTQGITLSVAGEGTSVAPANERTVEDRASMKRFGVKPDWRSLADFFRRLEANPPAIHFATFVGAGGLRDLVIGRENRPATPAELAEMQLLADEAMRDGALGVSTSLMYVPHRFASTEEIVALAKVAARYGGIYATHQRSEGDGINASLDEVFRIAREAKIPTHIYHLKTMYRQNWGRMPNVLRRIEAARGEGLDVTASVYPYVAAGAGLFDLLPLWAREGSLDAVLTRLRDPSARERIKKDLTVSTLEWENEYYGAGGAEGFLISDVINPSLKPFVGKRLAEVARERGQDPVDALMDLVVEDKGGTGFVSFIMDEPDVRLALKQRWAAFCNDSPIQATDGPLSQGKPHPRAYGSFPRILGRYVREEKLMALEEAIRKATSLAAQILGVRDRGLVREGFWADLVVFDPDKIADRATFEQPHQYSAGIDFVMVDGELVLDDGRMTNARPGKVIRGPGYRPAAAPGK